MELTAFTAWPITWRKHIYKAQGNTCINFHLEWSLLRFPSSSWKIDYRGYVCMQVCMYASFQKDLGHIIEKTKIAPKRCQQIKWIYKSILPSMDIPRFSFFFYIIFSFFQVHGLSFAIFFHSVCLERTLFLDPLTMERLSAGPVSSRNAGNYMPSGGIE